MKPVLIGLLRFYQIVLSKPLHWLGGPMAGCRFTPTCSQYCLDAVKSHGSLRGAWLGLKRIARCHPWGGQGEDPVPPVVRSSGCQCEAPPPDTPDHSPHSKSPGNSLSTPAHSTALSSVPSRSRFLNASTARTGTDA